MRVPHVLVLLGVLLLASSHRPALAASGPDSTSGPIGIASTAPAILHVHGEVLAKNDDWVRTGLHLERGDVVMVIATGSASLGQYSGSTGPNGEVDGDGKLDAKIGTGEPFGVGAHYAFVDTIPGILKLRLRDTKYTDNSGSYQVEVLVLRGGAVPEALPFRDEE